MSLKKTFCSLILCVAFSLVFISGNAFAQNPEQGEVDTQNSLNVRSNPGTWSEIIGSKQPGDLVEYIDTGDGWGKLTDGSGFVSLDYVTKHDHKPMDRSEVPEKPSPERIMLDPGHGGIDSGAAAHGLLEKEIVLDIAHRVKLILEEQGFAVRLTRETDVFVSLDERVALANSWDADQFISIHANGFSDPEANGIETFYYPGSSTGKAMAAAAQNALIEQTDRTDRGIFEETFFVLRNTSMPAILVEAGFVTNEDDASKLTDGQYLETVAGAIAKSVTNQ